jgi:Bacterial Ig-like domain
MRKTLLLFTTMALALLLAAGMAGAALPAPTVVGYGVGTATATVPLTTPPTPLTGVNPAGDITVKFSEAMNSKSFQISNHSTSTTSSQTFYLLPGDHFTALSPTKNPPRFCIRATSSSTACPERIPAKVSYSATGIVGSVPAIPANTAILNPSSNLQPNTPYTAVVEGTADGDYVAVKDADGTPMATDYIFSFTTGGGGPGPL